MTGSQTIDGVAEGVAGAVAGAVDEVDRAFGLERRLQHRQRRGDADPAADQHQRLVAIAQHEVARRREQLQDIARGDLLVQVLGHQATGLALDADAQFAAIGGRRERIVAPLLLAVEEQAQADVLARLVGDNRTAIDRAQVERGDDAALGLLARDAEGALATPAARGGLDRGIGLLLGTDQQVGQLLIGRAPGVDHGIGRDLGAQHFADRAQQAGADDRVMLGLDLQRHMLVHDLRRQIAQRLEAVDMLGIHQHAVGERTRLVAAGLVGLVEQRAHLGKLAEHDAVEMPGQGLATGFKQRDGRFHNGALGVVQHGGGSSSVGSVRPDGPAPFNAMHMPGPAAIPINDLAQIESYRPKLC